MERNAFSERAAREVATEMRDLRVSVQSARKELEAARLRIRNSSSDPTTLRALEREVSGVAAQVALGGRLEREAGESKARSDALSLSVSPRHYSPHPTLPNICRLLPKSLS